MSLATVSGQSSAPATNADPHAYFNELLDRPDYWKSYSLRDPSQLTARLEGGYAHSNKRPLAVTYDPTNDPDPRRQDAAKVVIPAGVNSLPNQVRLPMGTQDGHTYLVTWDAWYGREFRFESTGIINYKTYQFSSNGDRLWTEVRTRLGLSRANTAVGLVDMRAYKGGKRTEKEAFGPNTSSKPPLTPQVDTFEVMPETWTRYWWLLEQRANDYDRLSLWVADVNRNPALIVDRAELNAHGSPNSVDKFWLEFNTSTREVRPDRAPLVAYVRNVVMLRDIVGKPADIMRRP